MTASGWLVYRNLWVSSSDSQWLSVQRFLDFTQLSFAVGRISSQTLMITSMNITNKEIGYPISDRFSDNESMILQSISSHCPSTLRCSGADMNLTWPLLHRNHMGMECWYLEQSPLLHFRKFIFLRSRTFSITQQYPGIRINKFG